MSEQPQLNTQQKLAIMLVATTQKTSALIETITHAQSKGLSYQIPNKDIVAMQLSIDAGAVLASVYVLLKALTATEQEIAELTSSSIEAIKQQFPEVFAQPPATTTN